MNIKPIFYTMPPSNVPYFFILINMNKFSSQLSYVKKFRRSIEAIIIDSGVEIFRNKDIFDYPEGGQGRVDRAAYAYYRLKRLLGNGVRIWVTVPDYPDDYHHRQLWLSDKETNIERTIRNINYAVDNYPDVDWLIPIQGHNKQPKSIIRAITPLQESGILNKYNQVAIANLCVEDNTDILASTVRIARELIGKNKWIHVFGPKLRALKRIKRLIDSFDSTSWTRPVNSLLGNWSCKTQFERVLYFSAWYLRYLEVVK